ncbi:MAG: formylglycine-generating enzyme family protein [Magnetococcales bacterium]|nr:formylglycine-generating enzyme family protein [Magnetococcales bacterium]
MNTSVEKTLLYRLDHLPAGWALLMGVMVGVLGGAVLLWLWPEWGWIGYVVLLGLAVVLAWTGKPVVKRERRAIDVPEQGVEEVSTPDEQEIVGELPAETVPDIPEPDIPEPDIPESNADTQPIEPEASQESEEPQNTPKTEPIDQDVAEKSPKKMSLATRAYLPKTDEEKAAFNTIHKAPHRPLDEFVEIPAGRFMMGSPDSDDLARDNEKPQRDVTISSLSCMRYPVTRKLYQEVIGKVSDHWDDQAKENWPITEISWLEAVIFCNQWSERVGLTPCYEQQSKQIIWHRRADGIRLPTEAEWEYLCRAGTETPWFFGETDDLGKEYAWFEDNSENRPHAVGTRKANPWGLYDLSGNVFEWCWDRYGDYSKESQENPVGLEAGDVRVIRGGSFLFWSGSLRSADRVRVEPVNRVRFLGFRCVRGASPASLDH